MRISDWSSDVCSSDLVELGGIDAAGLEAVHVRVSLMRNRGICEARTMAATAGRRQSRTVHKRAVRAIAPWRRLVSGASLARRCTGTLRDAPPPGFVRIAAAPREPRFPPRRPDQTRRGQEG